MLAPCDLNSPRDIQVHHPDAVEGTFHSCSSRLHVLLTFFSVEKKNVLANKLNFHAMQTNSRGTTHVNK